MPNIITTAFLTNKLFLGLLFTFLTSITFSIIAQDDTATDNNNTAESQEINKAVFAGGCFWCIEADFEKLDGVISVDSGYSGGSSDTANYKAVTKGHSGHYEVVEVNYNAAEVSYAQLVDYFWRHIDPTDPHGQFCDKGASYKSAIFYNNDKEKAVIDNSLQTLNADKPFAEDIVTAILPSSPFYLAESYHQDYYKKNPIRYNYYRRGCGRDARVAELWGK